jgi:hypothetical protein
MACATRLQPHMQGSSQLWSLLPDEPPCLQLQTRGAAMTKVKKADRVVL